MPLPKSGKVLLVYWYAIAVLVILLDQWTKWLSLQHLNYEDPVVINEFFNLTLRYNYGVAFSMFDQIGGGQRWPLSILAFVVSIGIVVWIYRSGQRWGLEALGLSLVLGGAIGNLYDRVTLGYVVDFIEWHYKQHYWPAFNIADSAICIGAGFLLFDGFFGHGAKRGKASEAEHSTPS